MSAPDEKTAEKLKNQANQMFNLVEVPVMECISHFLSEPPSVLYNVDMPTRIDPFILMPMDDYKKNICLKYSLVHVDADNNPIDSNITFKNRLNIPDLLKYDTVKEGIGFLFYSIKCVYTSIVASTMINSKPLVNTIVVLDDSDWSFSIRYKHNLAQQKQLLEENLGKLLYIRNHPNDYSESVVSQARKEFGGLVTAVTKITEEYTDEIKDTEQKINDDFSTRSKMIIVIEEMHKDDLPKPILKPSDDVNVNNMPQISAMSLYNK